MEDAERVFVTVAATMAATDVAFAARVDAIAAGEAEPRTT
jgi:hypothetical protein